jgi:hypothetical protein
VAVLRDVRAAVLAEAMPRRWSDFIRNAPMETVKPFGTRAAAPPAPQQYAAPQTYRSGSATALYYPPATTPPQPPPPSA